jgi:RNA polymerase sigma-70 factor (ECF subfamily)
LNGIERILDDQVCVGDPYLAVGSAALDAGVAPCVFSWRSPPPMYPQMNLPSAQRALWLARCVLPHEPELRAWLARRTMRDLVDDIVQESYAILAGLESVEHIRDPRSYLFEVAKSVVLLALRRSRVIAFEALTDAESLRLPSSDPGPESLVAARQELGLLAAMIGRLPPKCREALVLRKIHGLSQREVAARMGVSENTIEKHIGKALGILTGKIGRGGDWSSGASTYHRETPGTNRRESSPRKRHRD